MDDPLLQKIAISQAKGLHATSMRQLFDRIGSEKEYFALSQAQLTNISGISNEIYTDAYRHKLLEAAKKECDFVRNHHMDAFFLTDNNYPQRLGECDDAPLMLYKLGSCNLDSPHTVGIVGTRHATFYGIDFAARLVQDLAARVDGLVIVSGLAYGIDVSAHRAALAAGVPTVGVVAHGLDMIYPADHRAVASKMIASGGAVVTEYCSGERIHRSNFLARNRIIAGLCDCVVVVESDYRGGSMSTARIAMQYSRDVFAVPGRVTDTYSHGTNKLIADNVAAMLTGASDLMTQMGWADKQVPEEQGRLFATLTPDQQKVLDFLKAHEDATVNEMCVGLGMTYAHLTDHLFQLEMNDVIKALPGGRFAIR